MDGTLLDAGGATAESFDTAVEDVIGRRPGPHRVAMSGKTDPSIALEILAFAGLDEHEAAHCLPVVLERLQATLAAAAPSLREKGRVLPGVEHILARGHAAASVVQSVLTGNLEANAGVKVRAFGLDQWLDLDVGAFGSDRSDREELVPLAVERARRLRGLACGPADVWVVGDTPRDLACARAAGASCLLVGTGRFSVDELRGAGADHVMEDLSDVEGVCAVLLS
ncbi:MAG: haloacid dehalogenase-like hydrolase [Actinomycetota bacterium]|nr:haloacid dehalogenase-like hydrolase [Actinomycetota bacterium]